MFQSIGREVKTRRQKKAIKRNEQSVLHFHDSVAVHSNMCRCNKSKIKIESEKLFSRSDIKQFVETNCICSPEEYVQVYNRKQIINQNQSAFGKLNDIT